MIAFRFDIDTRRGLVERVPPLLDLLDEFGVRATFFCVMGREANPYEILRLRLLAKRSEKSPLNVGAKGGPARVIRAAVFPRAVGHRNPSLLREIVRRGHELQPHGWSHIQWQRNLDGIDVERHLRRSLTHYERIMGSPAIGFASPGRSWNASALLAFDDAGLTYVGDMDGDQPFRPAGFRHLQLPITRFETIAQMRQRGLDDEGIAATYLDDIETNPSYCCLYEHPDDVDDAGLRVLAQLFRALKQRGTTATAVTLAEVAAAVKDTAPVYRAETARPVHRAQ
ncbi:4-deoxy-4-formamido-L-arabinose-phosphoundecaprenol deformylase [soil metagenome]